MTRHGMTLIELLAVVAILALAAGITATAVPIGRGESGIHTALAEAVALDARARLAARSGAHGPGPSGSAAAAGVRIVRSDRGESLAAIDPRSGGWGGEGGEGEVIAQVVAPAGTVWTLEPLLGDPVKEVLITPDGRSIDYAAVLHTDGGETRRVDLLGLTGCPRKGGPS